MSEKVFYDSLDEEFDDYDRFDLEMWFDNKSANRQYVVFGSNERWDVKGSGYFDKVYYSVMEAIDGATDGVGMFYLKIYEKDYGRLYVDVIHHDGRNSYEIRELTHRGYDMYLNHRYDEDIIPKLIHIENYTRNVKYSKRGAY